MEFLNSIPIELDYAFVSMGIIIGTIAVYAWVAIWFGKWTINQPKINDLTWKNVWLDGWWNK